MFDLIPQRNRFMFVLHFCGSLSLSFYTSALSARGINTVLCYLHLQSRKQNRKPVYNNNNIEHNNQQEQALLENRLPADVEYAGQCTTASPRTSSSDAAGSPENISNIVTRSPKSSSSSSTPSPRTRSVRIKSTVETEEDRV